MNSLILLKVIKTSREIHKVCMAQCQIKRKNVNYVQYEMISMHWNIGWKGTTKITTIKLEIVINTYIALNRC